MIPPDSLPERTLFRASSPFVEIASKSPGVLLSASKKPLTSYAYLFGQQGLSNDWPAQRRQIKDMISGLMI